MRTAVVIGATSLATAVGCGSCDGPPEELRVREPRPYVRCLAAEPDDVPSRWEAGRMRFVREGRTVRAEQVPRPLRVAAFAGPGAAGPPGDEALARVDEGDAHLLLVLGGVGEDAETARRTLRGLGTLGVPVFVIAGGRDDAAVLDDAFGKLDGEAARRVMDARPLRRIVLGKDELVLVSGAPHGRYARTETACGVQPGDLETAAETVGARGEARRWLVSWAVPAGSPLAQGLGGVDAGDDALRNFADSVGARGGLFAWPRTQALRPVDRGGDPLERGQASEALQLVVTPLAGPAVERADGTRVRPRASHLELTSGGLQVSVRNGTARAKGVP